MSTPIPIEAPETTALAVEPGAFAVRLPVFEGPLQLLLHLIESRQLDVLTVPLADLADGYVAYIAGQPVDPVNLAEFVTVAAQLILLKSRRLLPGETEPAPPIVEGEPDEDELRRRLIEYRALRDAAQALGGRDMVAPLMRREPRESDLPEMPAEPLPVRLLVEALDRLAAVPEPEAAAPEVVAREITIGMQIRVLLAALADQGRVVLQSILASCGSRTEKAVTMLAALELVRRRQVRAEQEETFGPILLEPVPGAPAVAGGSAPLGAGQP